MTESLAAVAERLYGLDPGEFLAARTEAVAAARKAKDRELSAAIQKLRKPTRSAWLVNLLQRQAPEELGALLELADALAEAQQSLSGAQLRSLTTQRNQAVGALVRRAQTLGAEHGYTATEAIRAEVSATLSAALADPAARDVVERGVCTAAITYGGFGLGLGQDTTARPALRVVPGGGDAEAAGGAGIRGKGGEGERGRAGAGRQTASGEAGKSGDAAGDPAALLARIEQAQARIATLTGALAEGEQRLTEAAEAEQSARTTAADAAAEADRLRAELAAAEQHRDEAADAAATAKLATAAARATRDERASALAEAQQAMLDLVAAAKAR